MPLVEDAVELALQNVRTLALDLQLTRAPLAPPPSVRRCSNTAVFRVAADRRLCTALPHSAQEFKASVTADVMEELLLRATEPTAERALVRCVQRARNEIQRSIVRC